MEEEILTNNSLNLLEPKIIENETHCALCGALPNRLIEDEPELGFLYCTRCYRQYPKNEKFHAVLLNKRPIRCLKCGSINFIEDTTYKSEINGVDYIVKTIFCLDCKERMIYCLIFDRIFSGIVLNVQVIRNIDPNTIYLPEEKNIEQKEIIENNLQSQIKNSEIKSLSKKPKLIKKKTELSFPHNYTFFENQLKDLNQLIGLFSDEEDQNYYILSQLVHDISHIRKKMKSLQPELQDCFKEFIKKTENLEKRAEDGETYSDKIFNVVHDRAINAKIILMDLFNYVNWSITTAFETWRRNEEAGIVVDNKKHSNELMQLYEMCYKLFELLNIISTHLSLWTIFHGSTQLTSEYESFKVLQDNVSSFKMKNKQFKEFNRFSMTILDEFDGLEFNMKKLRTLLEISELEALSNEETNVSKAQKVVSLQSLIDQLNEKRDKIFLLVKDVRKTP